MPLDLWQRGCERLATELPEQQFNTWIRPLPAAEVADEGDGAAVVTVRVPNRFKLDWIRNQYAGRIESVDLSGFARTFPAGGGTVSTPASVSYTPKSASVGLIQNLPWDLVGSVTAQYVERAPKPAELFSGGPHDATATFDKAIGPSRLVKNLEQLFTASTARS